MATVSAGILTFLVVISVSICVESFPNGCTKLIGSPKDGIPGEFLVKVYSHTKPAVVVKIMLELTNSDCEGKLWRSSNPSTAVLKPITCSKMLYLQGFGFFAKLSDAAVIWVSEWLYRLFVKARTRPPPR